jgi:hypothetical protein
MMILGLYCLAIILFSIVALLCNKMTRPTDKVKGIIALLPVILYLAVSIMGIAGGLVTDQATAEYANNGLVRKLQGRGLAVAYR